MKLIALRTQKQFILSRVTSSEISGPQSKGNWNDYIFRNVFREFKKLRYLLHFLKHEEISVLFLTKCRFSFLVCSVHRIFTLFWKSCSNFKRLKERTSYANSDSSLLNPNAKSFAIVEKLSKKKHVFHFVK